MLHLLQNEWITSEFTRAFSWTLIHSLWQGLAAAIIAGLIISCTRHSKSGLRYHLLTGVFALFLLATIITFFNEYGSSYKNVSATPTLVESTTTPYNYTSAIEVPRTSIKGSIDSFKAYFDQHAPLVALVWFIVFMIQCMKLMSGIYFIETLRRKHVSSPGEAWNQKLSALCGAVGITQPIIFLESQMVKMPVVLGYLKPTILVPIGLLTKLPPEQVETILLHELAHIKRKDYLVNLLQNVAETIFFFNPAVKWISNAIREEREACCDDTVLAHTSNKTAYLQALVTFHQHSIDGQYALGLMGKNSSLLNRVKRMLNYENNKLNIMEKLFLVSGLIAFSAFGVLNTDEKALPALLPIPVVTKTIEKPEVKPVTAPIIATPVVAVKPAVAKQIRAPKVVLLKDTVPKTSTNFSHVYSNTNNDGTTQTVDIKFKNKDTGKEYRVKKLNDKITDFYIDDVRIPESQWSSYQGVLDEIDAAQKRTRELAAKRREEMKVRSEEARAKRAEMNEKRKAEMATRKLEQKERMDTQREKLNKMNLEMSEKRKTQALERRERDKERRKLHAIERQNTRNELSSIVSDLLKENVISNTDKVSFTLNSTTLEVNGTKQPAELHKKLKEKYLRKDGDSITYSKNGSNTNTNINRN